MATHTSHVAQLEDMSLCATTIFPPLFRSAIGFDRVPTLLDAAMRSAETVDSYPPYNIEKTSEDAYRISMAVAGFSTDDLSVEVRDGVLFVKGTGSSEEKNAPRYLLHPFCAAIRPVSAGCSSSI